MSDSALSRIVEAIRKRMRGDPAMQAEGAREGAEQMANMLPPEVMPLDAVQRQRERMRQMDEMLRQQ